MSKKSKVTLREEIVRERRKKMAARDRTEAHFRALRINTLMDALRAETRTFLMTKYGDHPLQKEDELYDLYAALQETVYQEFEA